MLIMIIGSYAVNKVLFKYIIHSIPMSVPVSFIPKINRIEN